MVDTIEYPLSLAHTMGLGAGEAYLVISHVGQIRSASPAAESLLGYEPEQLINMYFPELWYSRRPSDAPRAGAHVQKVELMRRDGLPVPVTMSTTTLSGDSPGDQLLTLIRNDDREQLNELLLHIQRLTGIGTMTASVAHELTSPISIMSASLANLKDEMATGDLTPEQLERYVAMMDQSVARAARIVEVLRHYTHNDGELSMAVTSAEDILRDALTMVEQQFRKRANVEIEVEIEGDLDTIVADHNRLTQVLINLLTNARDAMQPAGGTVHVRFWLLEKSAEPVLQLNGNDTAHNGHAQTGRDYFAFSVSDSGPGIPQQVLDQLFEPFFTTKPSGAGTGLGLFISHGIVDQHHGRMWAQNNPDGGATLMVVLPKRPIL